MSKGCENHCSILKQANETIKRMAEWIEGKCDTEICHAQYGCNYKKGCKDCIIKYFEGLED
jgi:hypothetical protein